MWITPYFPASYSGANDRWQKCIPHAKNVAHKQLAGRAAAPPSSIASATFWGITHGSAWIVRHASLASSVIRAASAASVAKSISERSADQRRMLSPPMTISPNKRIATLLHMRFAR